MPRSTFNITSLLLLATAFTLGAVTQVGCASTQEQVRQRRPGETNRRITAFVLEGVEAFKPAEIKSGLSTRADPGWRAKPAFAWIPLIGADHEYFNHLEWRKDLKRIRTFYKSRGYYNVEILSENKLWGEDDSTVKLKIVIKEGKPTRIGEIAVEGLDELPKPDRHKATRNLPISKGDIFEESEYLTAKRRIIDRLERQGYAYANITGRATVYPDERNAEIRYVIDPGPKAVFGDIEIRGLETIPESYIRSTIDLEEGTPYSSQALQAAQKTIYDLEVFSLVSVLPAHQAKKTEGEAEPTPEPVPTEKDGPDTTSDGSEEIQVAPEGTGPAPTPGPPARREAQSGISNLLDDAQAQAESRMRLDPEVPIVIQLKEAQNLNIRLGLGVALERNRQDAHLIFDLSDRNFLGGLRQFQLLLTGGYAVAPGIIPTGQARLRDAARQGVIGSAKVEFVQPWLVGGGRTNFRITPSIKRDVQIGYKLTNPTARIGLDRAFTDHISAGVGYRFSYFNFDEIDPDLAETTPLGEDFQEEFLLEYFEQTLTFDYRDNPLDPRSGFLAQLTVQEAARYIFGGEFTFLKATASTEGYIPFDLWLKWVLALRMEFGVIYNLEPTGEDTNTQQVPTTSRFDSGGRQGLRSFGHDSLSIYQGTVPVGGSTLLEMSVEPRFRIVDTLAGVGDLWGSLYLDAATVERGEFLTSTPAAETFQSDAVSPGDLFGNLMYGVGAGLWWVTPIGPVRVDFAYTVSPIDDDPRFRLCQDGTSAAAAGGACPLQPPEDDDLLNSIAGYNFIIGIGHSF